MVNEQKIEYGFIGDLQPLKYTYRDDIRNNAELERVLDITCGSSSLLLNVRKQMGPHGIGKIYGQEKNITTYNLARMNMLLHGVKDTEFDIHHGDSLKNDWNFTED